jgi:predicted MFS family arabinose efflux permease
MAGFASRSDASRILIRVISLWRERDFVKLWVGQSISQVGSRITRTALPFVAVLSLGAGPFEMGVLGGASAAATLAFGLFAGAWADRLRRRPILIGTDLARAAVLAFVPLAAMRHSLSMGLLYAVAAVAGALTVLFDSSYQAYVPSLVERERIVQANAKLALSDSMAEISGPGLAGFLVGWLTAPIAIAFDAVSFVVSAASLALIRKHEPAPERVAGSHMLREIADGLRCVWHSAYLRPMALRSATAAFFMGSFGSLYPLLTVKVLGLSPAAIGVIVSVGGAFAIAGSLFAERVVRRFGIGPTFLGAVVLSALTSFLHPLAHGSVVLACVFLVAGQCGDIVFPMLNISEVSLRQAVAPPHMLARVNSAMNLLFTGVIPLGAFTGGAVASALGVRTTMLIGAAGYLASALWLVFSPIPALRELPTNSASSAVT